MINLESWPLNPEVCPADVDFVEYFGSMKDQRIFHFGTGEHHLVGRRLYKTNDILGLCASELEMLSYCGLCCNTGTPEINHSYQVLFGDIYLLNFYFLPEYFDVVTLFHLAELRSEYALLTDAEIIDHFYMKLLVGGELIAYKGSFGFPRVEELFNQHNWTSVREFNSLRIFTK